MSKSEKIRALGREGLATATIADQLGVKYQHAYKVLRDADLLLMARAKTAPGAPVRTERPALTSATLLESGFRLEG